MLVLGSVKVGSNSFLLKVKKEKVVVDFHIH